MMPEGVSQWVWASDFHGFGYRDLDPRMARIFLHVSAEHYPERLVRCLPPAGSRRLNRMTRSRRVPLSHEQGVARYHCAHSNIGCVLCRDTFS